MASPLPSPPTTPSATRLRAPLLLTAGVLGLAMLAPALADGTLGVVNVLKALVGWSFATCGVLLWSRRPGTRLGPLMTVVGMLWLLGRTMTLVPTPIVFTLGLWLTDLWAVAFVVFLLSFPTGRLHGRADRAIVGIFVFVTVPLEFLWLAFLASDTGLNALGFAPDASAAHDVDRIQRVLVSLGAVLLAASLGRRWVRSSGPGRVQMAPVLVGGVAILLESVSWIFLSSGSSQELLDDAIFLAQIAIPVAVVAVMIRGRLARVGVADLVVELGRAPTPARLRDVLANALGDPTLQVAYWSPDRGRYVDASGEVLELPETGSSRAVTVLEREGDPEAAIIHDAALLDEPGLLASVASAMRLAVENDRLTAAVEGQLAEVRASRARIVTAGDAERRRIERDLHDGAQLRLVSLTLALRLARTKLGDDADPAVRRSIDEASEEARAALAELRELARGIHPQILTSAGLHAAFESLAGRSPVPVSVAIDPDARFEAGAEAIAYFVVSESLANVAKHANATRVEVRGGWEDGVLTVEVADDGQGGADGTSGSGLRGLVDRLSAADGALEVISPSGGGTRVVARIPTGAPSHPGDPAPAPVAS